MYHRPSIDHTYTVYTKSHCPACDKTKTLLPKAKFINCDTYLEEADAFLDFIWSLPEADSVSTFPMIFKNGTYIGGYSELSKQFNTEVSF